MKPTLLLCAALALSANAAITISSYEDVPGIAFGDLNTSAYAYDTEFVVEASEAIGHTIEFGDFFEPVAAEDLPAPVTFDFTVERDLSGLEYAVTIVKAPDPGPEPFEFDFDRAMVAPVPRQPFGIKITEPSTMSLAALGILPFLRRHR